MEPIGKYRLVRKLAEGGMAEVFLATVEGPGGFQKPVVVKRVLPELSKDQSFIAMFMSEAKLVAQLNHPNIVQVFDFGLHDGSYSLVMEYVDGFNLRGLYKRAQAAHQPIPFELAARMVAGACEGLAYAHTFSERGTPLNIIHRDISPENLLVGRNGVVKVADFGIARVAGQKRMTLTGTVRGKLVYMAPEQMQGEAVDCRVDVFALGIVLYELICGRRPFEAKSEVEAMKAILTGTMIPAATWRPDMPPELQAIIDRAMARSSAERFKDCTELQMALEKFIALRGVPANTQTIGKLVASFIDPEARPVPAVTLILPPREVRTVASRPQPLGAQPEQVKGRSKTPRYVALGLGLGVAAIAAIALWPASLPPEPVLVPPPPAPLAAAIIAPAAPVKEAFAEEDYPVPPPPPAAPPVMPKQSLGTRVAKLFKHAPAVVDAGVEAKPNSAAKLADDEPKTDLKVPEATAAPLPVPVAPPRLKGRLTTDPRRGVIISNDTPFKWTGCELRLPMKKFFRFEDKEAIEPNDSDNIRVSNLEDDSRAVDQHMQNGWGLIRCHEGASYLWWGSQTLP